MKGGRREGGKAGGIAGLLALLLVGFPPSRLPAQARVPTPSTVPDTSKHPKLVSPVGALWRSLLIPGWGQARTGRNFTGAAFVAFEGVAIMMTVRAAQELDYMEATGSDSSNVANKRQQIQDWVVLWGFNHLFAAAEAFVAAHLMDFPKELKIRAVPGGFGVSLPLP